MDFCNKQLEFEQLTSGFLKGIVYPKEYINLISNICNLKFIETSIELSESLKEIQKKIVTKTGIIKESRVKNYYLGNDDVLHELFQTCYQKVSEQEKLYDLVIKEHMELLYRQMENSVEDLSDFEQMSNAIHSATLENEVLKQRDQVHLDLRIIKTSLFNILMSYGSGEPFSTKEKYTQYSKEYQLFINSMFYNLTEVVSDPLYSMLIYTALSEIINTIPKNELDIYGKDKLKNLISVLLNPQDYYSKCSREEIDSPQVAQSFYKVYPEYMEMFLDMHLDKYEQFDQQKQINFRKCFNLVENQGQLISMCSASLSNQPKPVSK